MGATVTSFYFLCFLLALLIIYYVVPKRFQWLILLLFSIAYYLLSGNGILIVYPVMASFVAFAGAYLIEGAGEDEGKRKLYFAISLLLLTGSLFVLKYVNFIINTVNGIVGWFSPDKDPVLPTTSFLIPLGISFYTFSILGYLIDVYNKIAKAEKNFFKFLSFGMYFPMILSGPIMKYREDASQLYVPHKLEYKNITFGAQRMLWGFFKTIVISERMRMVVDTVYNAPGEYHGIYVIFATVCYAFQLYTNFSGAMDIVLGISCMLGLSMPENFKTPFFSKNISEYWRRWHITLGVWMKDYVFYPLLRTKWIGDLQTSLKNRLGKKKGKQLTTFIAMFILWFTVGVWHGGDWKYVIGSGLLHWFYIVTGEILTPPFAKLMDRLHIDPKAKWVEGIRMVRTFILVNIGFIFFRANSFFDAVLLIKNIFVSFDASSFFTGGVFNLGLDVIEAVIALTSLAILIAVSAMQDKGVKVREKIAGFKLPVRWIIWYALLFYTILLGYYGPGFSAAEFIYQGF